MKLQSKFNFGDVLYIISKSRSKKEISCAFCSGIGHITGANNKTHQCPDCYGRCVTIEYQPYQWAVLQTVTIGEIRIKVRCDYEDSTDSIFTNYGNQKAIREEEYMCYETGIGSGSVWSVEKLFNTSSEAQAECDRLNKLELEKS